MASTLIACPSCKAKVQIPGAAPHGMPVQCDGCGIIFTIGAAAPTELLSTGRDSPRPPLPVQTLPPDATEEVTLVSSEGAGASSCVDTTEAFFEKRKTAEAETTEVYSAQDPQATQLYVPAAKTPPTLAESSGSAAVAGKEPRPAESVRIPGYEILGVLGRGGMGVVYKARQLRLNRLVAIKMILAGGHAGPLELARFRTEAEAVARLQHPQIVQIYEIGEHQGLPFFSLEFCNGGSLAKRLGGSPLPAPEAARLVESLSRAMHVAHQQQIVHRDLKPSNVLLQVADSRLQSESGASSNPSDKSAVATLQSAIPKITDFGLAKKLDDAGQTQSGAAVGTPSYMAPEQAEGKPRAIGPKTDVYALGAILYELLTGRPPFRAATAMDTLLQVVTEEPVPPTHLQPKTPRDLETICLKCLQKSPEKRYASAAELAEDLRRFRAGEPILARPVGRVERAWRWCRRNPLVASLTSLVILLLVGGTALACYLAWQAGLAREHAEQQALRAADNERKAVEQRKRADAEAGRAKEQAERADQEAQRAKEHAIRADDNARKAGEQAKLATENAIKAQQEAEKTRLESQKANKVAAFLVGLFDAADPLGITGYAFGPDAKQGMTLTANDILARGAKKIAAELKDQPETRASLLGTIGNVYRALGLFGQARPLLEEALKLRIKTLGDKHLDVARSWFELGWVHQVDGDDYEAVLCYRRALAIAESHPEGVEVVSRCRFNAAWLLAQQMENEEAEALFRAVLEERRKRLGDDHFEVAVARTGLAATLIQQQRPTEAFPLVLSALQTYRKHQGDESLSTAVSLAQNAMIALTLGQHAEAEKNLLKAVELVRKRMGDNHPYVAWAYGFLGETMRGAGKSKEAQDYYEQALKICREGIGLDHPLVVRALRPYASLLARAGKLDEAFQIYEEALEHQRKRRSPKHPIVMVTLDSYADFAASVKKIDTAIKLARQAVELGRGLPEGSSPALPRVLITLASLSEKSDPVQAEALYREGMELCRKRSFQGTEPLLTLLYSYGDFLFAQKRFKQADPLLREALTLAAKKKEPDPGLRMRLTEMIVRGPALAAQELRLRAFQTACLCGALGQGPLASASEYVVAAEAVKFVPPPAPRQVFLTKGELLQSDDLDPVRGDSYQKVFSVPLEAGLTYRIDLVSTILDSYLRLQDAKGKTLAYDDDSGGNLNARIVFTPFEKGTYRVTATTFKPRQTGQFTLSITIAPPPSGKETYRLAAKLTDADPADKLRPAYFARTVTVKLEAGKLYTIDLRSKEFDPYLRLETAEGKTLAQDDDSGGNLNSRILFRPAQTAAYRLVVTSYEPRSTGAFLLTVRE